MKDLTVIGIDIAKNYLQIHGTDSQGKALIKKRLTRSNFLNYMAQVPKCLIGLEACGGANYWAKELIGLGFEVKIMAPKKVKKFVENNKNDGKDAEACAIAVCRKDMIFVPIKNEMQLEIQGLHRIRSYYIKTHTGLINMIRGLLQEFGTVLPRGKKGFFEGINELIYGEKNKIPVGTRTNLKQLFADLKQLNETIARYTKEIETIAKEEETCKKIKTITGIGPITATALVAKIGNGSEFQKGRDLSAFLGLVPKQNCSGETIHLGKITKHGDRYLRTLLIHGGRASIKAALRKNKITGFYEKNDPHSQWMRQVFERKGWQKASVAVANKNTRMVVALLKNNTTFQPELAH